MTDSKERTAQTRGAEPSELELRERARVAARIGARLAIAIGAVVLCAWGVGWDVLKSMLPGAATMKPNTAACFVLLGLALELSIEGRRATASFAGRRRVAVLCGAVAAAVGLVTAIEYALGLHWPLDEVLFPTAFANSDASEIPARMSGATAVAMLATGLGLATLDRRTRSGRRPAQYLLGASAFMGLLALVGYVYGLRELYTFPGYASMAPHTSILFAVLGTAGLGARPEHGWMATVTGSGSGGLLARRMLPVAVLVPLLIGALCVAAPRWGVYDGAFSPALFCAAVIVVFALVTWRVARSLDRMDEELRRAMEEARASAENLRVTLQSIGDAVLVTDARSRITMLNPVAEKLTGWRTEDAIGRPLGDVFRTVDEETQEPAESPVSRVFRKGRAVDLRNHKLLVAHDGTKVPIADSAAPIQATVGGEVSGAVLVFRDQTMERERMRAIRDALEEREILLEEVHHRVKNNMQVISSILGLQAGKLADALAQEALEECRGRVRSMALVHEKLYQSDSLATIDFGEYMDDVVGEIADSVGGGAQQVDLVSDADSVRLDIDLAVPLGLILNELVTNALKHAFPGGRGGAVRVRLSRETDDRVVLNVSDDGQGWPPGFDWQQQRSMGVLMVRALADQIGGEVELGEGPGASVRVRFSPSASVPSVRVQAVLGTD